MNSVIVFRNYVETKMKGAKNRLKYELYSYLTNEDGAGVIELVLILVVLIGLVLVFKDKIGVLLNNIFTNINSSADAIYNN